MAEIINLRRFRKEKLRHAADAKAEETRIRQGRSKAEKLAARRAEDMRAARLEGHRLARPDRDES